MKRWLQYIGAQAAARRARAAATALPTSPPAGTADGAPGGAPATLAPADVGETLLAWLLDADAPTDVPFSVPERAGIDRLDALLDARHPPASLLPRTPAIIPPLMSLLRRADVSLPAISQHIARDLELTTEVLRQAGRAAYSAGSAGGTVADLQQALGRLGVDGMGTVIARVVLRPLLPGQAGPLSTAASARLWPYAEQEAQCAATLAAARGEDRFDAYLAGLVHCTGWAIAVRELDRLSHALPLPCSRSFVQQLAPRADALFAKGVGHWQLTPAITALCAAVGQHGLARTPHPLAGVLVEAQREATQALRSAPGPVEPGSGAIVAARRC